MRRSAATASRSSRCETRPSTVSRRGSSRHRSQQPRRVGPHDGEVRLFVGRAVVAAARARSRSVPYGASHARGAGPGRRRRGVQCRLGRPELPRAGPRGSSRGRDWMRGRVRERRVSGSEVVPRRLLQARSCVSVVRFRVGRSERRGGARDAYRAVPLTTELFEGRRYVRLRQLRHLLDDGELEDGLRWRDDAAA